MTEQILIRAERRAELGTGASRRLRRLADKTPGILYGGGLSPVPLAIAYRALGKAMQEEAFFSQILRLQVGEDTQACILREVQRHPATDVVQHIDFLRIREDVPVHMHVPLHFVNEDQCEGVKLGGGRLAHNLVELEVRCLPKDLPEYIAIDVAALTVGQSIHLSDLAMPDGVEIVALALGADHDMPVVGVAARRGGSDADAEEGAEDASESSAEDDS